MFFHRQKLKATKTKEFTYLLAATFLGVLLSFLVHALIEMPVIWLLTSNFETFSLGLTWSQWYTVHTVFGIVLFLVGIIGGFQLGRYWWRILYIEQRYNKKRG